MRAKQIFTKYYLEAILSQRVKATFSNSDSSKMTPCMELPTVSTSNRQVIQKNADQLGRDVAALMSIKR